ncbi:hypothetical protein YPPY06_2452, partial [Yersinia pestis PY-06]
MWATLKPNQNQSQYHSHRDDSIKRVNI